MLASIGSLSLPHQPALMVDDRGLARAQKLTMLDRPDASHTRPGRHTRRIAPARLPTTITEFEHLLQTVITRQSENPQASLLDMVPKTTTSDWRPHGSYKTLNKVTIPNCYPVLHIQGFAGVLLGCIRIRMTTYQPAANGVAEQFHRAADDVDRPSPPVPIGHSLRSKVEPCLFRNRTGVRRHRPTSWTDDSTTPSLYPREPGQPPAASSTVYADHPRPHPGHRSLTYFKDLATGSHVYLWTFRIQRQTREVVGVDHPEAAVSDTSPDQSCDPLHPARASSLASAPSTPCPPPLTARASSLNGNSSAAAFILLSPYPSPFRLGERLAGPAERRLCLEGDFSDRLELDFERDLLEPSDFSDRSRRDLSREFERPEDDSSFRWLLLRLRDRSRRLDPRLRDLRDSRRE
ncbi:hypothetical protein SprV_0401644600 [Sparganum proliferum]